MIGHLLDGLAEGGKRIGTPCRLLDVVEADDAKLVGYGNAELLSGGVHEAASQEIRHAECRIRTFRPGQHLPSGLIAAFVAGRAGSYHPHRQAVFRSGLFEGLLAYRDARRAGA
ncbi:hypothetical protein ASD44_14510 [Mesorhizobium sp. Root554]|nr:hypothetical protein ASD27_14515 [Mesorhizobium sp. Root1471]KQZ37637.1 hypothetical protein ASD44_14510 [Mesorhizobium sp. Root554]